LDDTTNAYLSTLSLLREVGYDVKLIGDYALVEGMGVIGYVMTADYYPPTGHAFFDHKDCFDKTGKCSFQARLPLTKKHVVELSWLGSRSRSTPSGS
jgi:hypothetical protein